MSRQGWAAHGLCAQTDRRVMNDDLTYGEMFAGYGGLGMGVQSVLGGEMTWCAEVDPAPSKILAYHWQWVPNLGDVTKVDWTQVPKVDVITGGSPCQDLSRVGKRAGLTTGTRSNLWAEMREAIAAIRPQLVVWENVHGAYSACADSEMGRCPRCVGGDPNVGHAPFLRALGRVVGDFSDLGYDTRWYGLRASDVGAPHERFRVFVFASDSSSGTSDSISGGLGSEQGSERRQGPADDSAAMDCDPIHTSEASSTRLNCWRELAPAITRWELTTGRRAPSVDDEQPLITEWLMGLPGGHVTDPAIGLSPNDQIRVLGNGVVPQQAAAATRMWLADIAMEGAA